jgi:hypothetical protein
MLLDVTRNGMIAQKYELLFVPQFDFISMLKKKFNIGEHDKSQSYCVGADCSMLRATARVSRWSR